jgi:predicted lysophospholipase L1 biosynthesis ABC-type transport system permease subunit
MYKIGCGRFTILGLFVWEYLIVILLSVLLALLLSTITVEYVQQMILQMIR